MTDFVVAFRAHHWDAAVAEMAARLRAVSAGALFLILADESKGVLPTGSFEKLAHSDDFGTFGLPSFPPAQVLWYNADYPLYLLRQNFPAATHFAMVEYDVAVNFPLLSVLEHARDQKIDLIAHYIHEASLDWEWREQVLRHLPKPLQAFLPFMVVSARAVDQLLARRQALPQADLRAFEDWPFCEAFIPTVIAQLPDAQLQEIGAHAILPHYTLDRMLHISDPYAAIPGSLAHPVRGEGNIARGKPATQSSIHPWWGAASCETDAARGNNGDVGNAQGFNTAPERDPWWQVDLQADYTVSKIVVFDRIDAQPCGRLIASGSVDGVGWTTLGVMQPGAKQPMMLAIAPPRQARFIRVTMQGEGELHLDEIEVYGKARTWVGCEA